MPTQTRETLLNNSLLLICGPTAVGKTSCSIQIAENLGCEIVSSDSRQIFKELQIGTAAPDFHELQRIKHHLIGSKSIHEHVTAVSYAHEALISIGKAFEISPYCILSGGSGLYIKAICSGFDPIPKMSGELRASLNKVLKEKGISYLQNELLKIDPEHYYNSDINNPQRLIRAIEVCMVSGKPFSSFRKGKSENRNFRIIKIGLERERKELYERINNRVDIMIKEGIVSEAIRVFPHRHLQTLNTVGYKELFDFFDGKSSFFEAIEKIKQHSRNYAKRQLTWFKADQDITWFHPENIQGILSFISKTPN